MFVLLSPMLPKFKASVKLMDGYYMVFLQYNVGMEKKMVRRLQVVRTSKMDMALEVLMEHYDMSASGVVKMLLMKEMEKIGEVISKSKKLVKAEAQS